MEAWYGGYGPSSNDDDDTSYDDYYTNEFDGGKYMGNDIIRATYSPHNHMYKLTLSGNKEVKLRAEDYQELKYRTQEVIKQKMYGHDYNYSAARELLRRNEQKIIRKDIPNYNQIAKDVIADYNKPKDHTTRNIILAWAFILGMTTLCTILFGVFGILSFPLHWIVSAYAKDMLEDRYGGTPNHDKLRAEVRSVKQKTLPKPASQLPIEYSKRIEDIKDRIVKIKKKTHDKDIIRYLDEIYEEDIPTLVKRYLAVPVEIRDTPKYSANKKMTANSMFNAAVTSIETNLNRLRDDVYSDDVDELEIHMRFLDYKYGGSGIDLIDEIKETK